MYYCLSDSESFTTCCWSIMEKPRKMQDIYGSKVMKEHLVFITKY